LILNTSTTHNTPWQHNTRNTIGLERITPDHSTIWIEYNCNPIPLSLENQKLEVNLEILESNLSNWISQSNFLFVWKHKQTIYIFQRLVKAFNEGVYSVRKHLKQIHHSKHNSVGIFKGNNRLKSRNNRLFWLDS